VSDQTNGLPPASVPPSDDTSAANQAGEILDRWPWVEPSVWTERMLTALEDGVKGGRWFRLRDKVYARRNLDSLDSAFQQVAGNQGAAGVDHQPIAMFEHLLEGNLEHLADEVQSGIYRPHAVKRVYIPKPGSKEQRPLAWIPLQGNPTNKSA
jgi:RNA-directed DNA polymerase